MFYAWRIWTLARAVYQGIWLIAFVVVVICVSSLVQSASGNEFG